MKSISNFILLESVLSNSLSNLNNMRDQLTLGSTEIQDIQLKYLLKWILLWLSSFNIYEWSSIQCVSIFEGGRASRIWKGEEEEEGVKMVTKCWLTLWTTPKISIQMFRHQLHKLVNKKKTRNEIKLKTYLQSKTKFSGCFWV